MTFSELSITVPRVAFFVALITAYTLVAECYRSVQPPSAPSERSRLGALTPFPEIAYRMHPVLFGNTSYRELRTDVKDPLIGRMTCRFVVQDEGRGYYQCECEAGGEYA